MVLVSIFRNDKPKRRRLCTVGTVLLTLGMWIGGTIEGKKMVWVLLVVFGGSMFMYLQYWSLKLSVSLFASPWWGWLQLFSWKNPATFSTTSLTVPLDRSFSPLPENSFSRMAWEKAPIIQACWHLAIVSRNLLLPSSILVRKRFRRIHVQSSLVFLPDVRAISRVTQAALSLSNR